MSQNEIEGKNVNDELSNIGEPNGRQASTQAQGEQVDEKPEDIQKTIKHLKNQVSWYKEKAEKLKLKQQTSEAKEQIEQEKPSFRKDASEMLVISKTKDFSRYVLNVTRKMLRDFRFVLSAKLQELAVSIVVNLVKANAVRVKSKNIQLWKQRFDLQTQAEVDLQVIEYLALYACEEKAILLKQYTNIAKYGKEVDVLIKKWKESDKKRFE